jgi:hypothetical protein
MNKKKINTEEIELWTKWLEEQVTSEKLYKLDYLAYLFLDLHKEGVKGLRMKQVIDLIIVCQDSQK